MQTRRNDMEGKHRITDAFARAKRENRGAFIAYLTAGFPSPEKCDAALDDLAAGGADVIELGVPFSDPFADGATIRSACAKALENGTTLDTAIETARRFRNRHPDTGIVVFSYFNPIFSKGLDAFAEAAAEAGIDAVLTVDTPLEERGEIIEAIRPRGISFIPLVAPSTPRERIAASVEGLENSFLYVITVQGTTGQRTSLPENLAARLDDIRQISPIPVAAGFGISTKAQAEAVSAHADGFVVGSHIVAQLARDGKISNPVLT